MSIQLQLPTELELAARRQAKESGEEVETFLIRQLAISLGSFGQNEHQSAEVPVVQQRFADRLHHWIALHPSVPHLDDSRESIYAGRG